VNKADHRKVFFMLSLITGQQQLARYASCSPSLKPQEEMTNNSRYTWSSFSPGKISFFFAVQG